MAERCVSDHIAALASIGAYRVLNGDSINNIIAGSGDEKERA